MSGGPGIEGCLRRSLSLPCDSQHVLHNGPSRNGEDVATLGTLPPLGSVLAGVGRVKPALGADRLPIRPAGVDYKLDARSLFRKHSEEFGEGLEKAGTRHYHSEDTTYRGAGVNWRIRM